MFTRSELEIKTTAELKDLCRRYGLKPTGNAGYKVSYITSLMAFPAIALHQMNEGKGLRRLTFDAYQNIGTALDQMNSPTDE
ncbi:SAP domain-containing protein [Nostoc sp.]|uniref:SAP domain-containing protein n=1 Tax=Nostoc sp. TaxID=1180 RepID=UPI002FFB93C1